MLTIRWTMNKDGRLTATFVRPLSLAPTTPQLLSVNGRRTQPAATPQRAAPGGRMPEPAPEAAGAR
ncbi:hypothetical protein [Roseiflexus sp.]|uniref:hypothetical protein n=1 Tax=Roseiflexus sp. TaxID=2562120 RepID=UPI0021DD7F7A|nr:hypothetical protein [Roseiflexus sp.]GIV82927.1 MAG: hypothetical protein KatS3mg051_2281 [Anaerolineae bacterium]GIV99003.1 MAG: hypothetical protein KatS3mg058_0407 [Roseiflexus sp.]